MGGSAANRAPGIPAPRVISGLGQAGKVKLCLSPPLPSGDRAASKPSCSAPSHPAVSQEVRGGGSLAAPRLWRGDQK